MIFPKQDDNKNVYFDLNDLREFLDIEKVKEYSLELIDDTSIKITFYDADGNIVETKQNKKEEE